MKKYLVKLSYGYVNDMEHCHGINVLLTHKEKQIIYNTINLINNIIATNTDFFIYISFKEVD